MRVHGCKLRNHIGFAGMCSSSGGTCDGSEWQLWCWGSGSGSGQTR